MRDQWLDDHVGGEAAVRPEFEAALGDTLQNAWRHPVGSVARPPSGPSRRAKVLIWAAAAALLLVGGAVVLRQTGTSSVTPGTDDASVSTTAAIETTAGVETTDEPTSTVVATSVALTTAASVVIPTTAEQQTVLDYLTALAEQRYDDAAHLLGEGGLSLEDRSDLRPFLDEEGKIPDLAESLKTWCQAALCQPPVSLSNLDPFVTATFEIDGVERSTTFVASTFEGSPAVHGLPLQLLDGASLADTVQCPTGATPDNEADTPDDTAYADLDADGWYERVILTHGDSGMIKKIVVCGTRLVSTTIDLPSVGVLYSPRRLAAIDIEGDGRDEILAIRSDDGDAITAELYLLSGSDLLTTQRMFNLSPSAGTSFGCTDLDDNGTIDIVNYTYSFVGGTDISNSTALNFTAVNQPGGDQILTVDGSLTLPAQADEAFRLISGYCGNFPTQTG
jgi:hypothetical protein